MIRLILRRLGATIVLLAMVSILAFVIPELGPDPAVTLVGAGATTAQIDAARTELGRDRPPVERYFRYVSSAMRGDLGESLRLKGQAISTIISQRIAVTLSLAFIGTLLASLVGFGLGVLGAWRSGGRTDRLIGWSTSIALATPPFWFANVLILGLAIRWRLFPATGWTPFTESVGQWARSMALPAMSLALFGFAAIARVTRAAAGQVLLQEYVRSARVRGLSGRQIIRHHVLRNTLAQSVPVMALQLIVAFGASAIVEIVFALPGLGSELVQAASSGDTPVIQGIALVAALLVAFTNLFSDVVQALLNPKVRI
jgi:peptide/nickel transport system permease protein